MLNQPETQTVDPFAKFRMATKARVGLGRCGDAVPTKSLLDFQLAHAQARDAVHSSVNFDEIAEQLAPQRTVRVHSAAGDRAEYLQRPDRGRILDPVSIERLQAYPKPQDPWDLVFVIADGLSATAITHNAVPTLFACMERLPKDWSIGPIILAEQSRVALGDAIATELGAKMVAILIGERPGLSVAESLGIYMTYDPIGGRLESERNCISNIHAHGLTYAEAGAKFAWLAREAKNRGLTGIGLKDEAPSLIETNKNGCLEHKLEEQR